MITKILRAGGLYLGEESDLMPPAPDNQDGFWEHMRVVELNDRLLESQGGWWDCPPANTGPAEQNVPDWAREAAEVVAPFAGREPWGWKDPRTSLTLPAWQKLLPDLKVVICLRNPLEVALSLKRRNTFSYPLSLSLWWIYNQRLLEAVPRERRIVSHYAAYFHEPRGEVARLLQFAGLDASADTVTRCAGELSRDLRHSHLKLQDLLDARVPSAVVDLYLQLCQESGWLSDGMAPPPAEAARPMAAPTAPTDQPLLGATRLDRLALLRTEAARLREELAQRVRSVASLEQQLASRPDDTRVDELNTRLQSMQRQADQRAAEQQALVNAQANELAEMRARLELSISREQPLRAMLAEAQRQLIEREEAAAVAVPADTISPVKLAYLKLVERIAGTVTTIVPEGAKVLVVSKGDDALLALAGRTAGHFPQDAVGAYPGYAPADSADAIQRIDTLRADGYRYLVFPNIAFWWIEHYADFAAHLRRVGKQVWSDANCIVYELSAVAKQQRRSRTKEKSR
jgi:hypothetical protein